MAREVTVQEFVDWVKKNENNTWYHGPDGDLDGFTDRTLKMKYIRFSLDTRDMMIFTINTEGFGNGLNADFREDEKDWTILDLLQSKLDAPEKKLETPKKVPVHSCDKAPKCAWGMVSKGQRCPHCKEIAQ